MGALHLLSGPSTQELNAAYEAAIKPESRKYRAAGDGTTDDTDAWSAILADAIADSRPVWLGGMYGISDDLQFLGQDASAPLYGTGQQSGFKRLTAGAAISLGMTPTGSANTGVTVWGRPGRSGGFIFDGNGLPGDYGIRFGIGCSHGKFDSIRVTNCDGDAIHAYTQNCLYEQIVADDSSGNGWVLDYGIQACHFNSCHGLSCDGWQWLARQSGGPGWGMSAQPQQLKFTSCINENGGSPSFADTGLGGMWIREGVDFHFDSCDLVDIASSDANAVALKLTPSTANGYVGRILIGGSSRLADVHIDANSGGVAQGMGGTNEPLTLTGGVSTSVFGGTITNGSTGPVYKQGKGVVSYTPEGTGAPARMDIGTGIVDSSVAEVSVVNTTVETTAAQLNIPRSVKAGDLLRLKVWGEMLNNSGSAVTYTWRLKIGATTVLASGASSVGTSSARAKVDVAVEVLVESTTAQRVKGTISGGRSTDTWGSGTAMPSPPLVGYGTAAENLAAGKQITLTVQMGTANAAADFNVHGATLEVGKGS